MMFTIVSIVEMWIFRSDALDKFDLIIGRPVVAFDKYTHYGALHRDGSRYTLRRGKGSRVREAFMRFVLATMAVVAATIQGAAQPSGVPSKVVEALDANILLMNKQSPIAINPSQKLTHVSRDGGVILYSIETAIPQEEWTQEMRERPSRETTKTMCGDKDTRLLLDYGFQMRYFITDVSGRYITSFFVSKDKCVSSQ